MNNNSYKEGKNYFQRYRVPQNNTASYRVDPILKFFNGGFMMPANEGGNINFPNQMGYRPQRMDYGGFGITTQTTTDPGVAKACTSKRDCHGELKSAVDAGLSRAERKEEKKWDKQVAKQEAQEAKELADQKAKEWADYINPALDPYGEKYGKKDTTFMGNYNRFISANPQFIQGQSTLGISPQQQYAMLYKMAGRSGSPAFAAAQRLRGYMGLQPTDRFTDQQLYDAVQRMGGIDKYAEWWKSGYPEIKQTGGENLPPYPIPRSSTIPSTLTPDIYNKRMIENVSKATDFWKNWYSKRQTLPQFSDVSKRRLEVLNNPLNINYLPPTEMAIRKSSGEYDPVANKFFLPDPTYGYTPSDSQFKNHEDWKSLMSEGSGLPVIGHELFHKLQHQAPQGNYNILARSVLGEKFVNPKKSGLDTEFYNYLKRPTGIGGPYINSFEPLQPVPSKRSTLFHPEMEAGVAMLRMNENMDPTKVYTPEDVVPLIKKYSEYNYLNDPSSGEKRKLFKEDLSPEEYEKKHSGWFINSIFKILGDNPKFIADYLNSTAANKSSTIPAVKNGGDISIADLRRPTWLSKYVDGGPQTNSYGIPDARELARQNVSSSTNATMLAKMKADAQAAEMKRRMQSAAKESSIGPARQLTPQEEQMRMVRNRTYAAQNAPYVNMNTQGTLSRAIPNVSMTGQPDVRTPEARWQKGIEHIGTAMEVAGALEGLGALRSGARTALVNTYKASPSMIEGTAARIPSIGLSKNKSLSSIINEALGTFKSGRKQAIQEGNDWVAQWVQHPETQSKIDEHLTRLISERNRMLSQIPDTKADLKKAWINYYDNTIKSFEHAKNYKGDVKEYPLSSQVVDFIKGNPPVHGDNWGVSFGHQFYPWMPKTGNKGYMDYVKESAQRSGNWITRTVNNPQRTSTTVHEATHGWIHSPLFGETGMHDEALNALNQKGKDFYKQWTKLRDEGKSQKEIEKIMGKNEAYMGYLGDPTEVHARVMELRKHYGLRPGQEVTPDMADRIAADIAAGKTPVDKSFPSIFENQGSFANVFNKLLAVPVVGVAGASMLNQKKEDGGEIDPWEWASNMIGIKKVPSPENYKSAPYNVDYYKQYVPEFKRTYGIPMKSGETYDQMRFNLKKRGIKNQEASNIMSFLNNYYTPYGELITNIPDRPIKEIPKEMSRDSEERHKQILKAQEKITEGLVPGRDYKYGGSWLNKYPQGGSTNSWFGTGHTMPPAQTGSPNQSGPTFSNQAGYTPPEDKRDKFIDFALNAAKLGVFLGGATGLFNRRKPIQQEDNRFNSKPSVPPSSGGSSAPVDGNGKPVTTPPDIAWNYNPAIRAQGLSSPGLDNSNPGGQLYGSTWQMAKHGGDVSIYGRRNYSSDTPSFHEFGGVTNGINIKNTDNWLKKYKS